MYKVTFKFENSEDITVFAAFGENLLEVARKTNVAIDAPCNGNAACGKCRVKLVKGELESERTRHISQEEYDQGWRLSCISKIAGDVEVLVPDIASAYRSRMKVADLGSAEEIRIFEKTEQDISEAGIKFKNDLEVIRVTMNPPSLDDTMPDNERLSWAVEDLCEAEDVRISFQVLQKLAENLRKYSFDVQCVIRRKGNKVEICDLIGAKETPVVAGLAVDIGTTTVSAVLVDMLTGKILAKGSAGNGQIRYGCW